MLSLLLLNACKSEYKFVLNAPKKIQTRQTLTLSVAEKMGKPIDSVHFSIDGEKITGQHNSLQLDIGHYRLGQHQV
ncbi:MAG: hypothetical protein QGH06_05260, partial [Lutibacter sp.]|nr:hypothetical protein [Lutibacter sp.]